MRVCLRLSLVVCVALALAAPGCKKSSSSGPGGPPGIPVGVAAAPGDTQVTISWNPVPRATSYTVYWDTSAGVTPLTGSPISVTTESHVHTGLTNMMTYYYVVTASNARGESDASSEVSATPAPGGTPPPPPTGVTALPGDALVTISWDPAPGATSYNIYWGITSGVTISSGIPIVGASNPHVHSGLMNGTTYYYVVTALNVSGQSAESAEVSATPAPGGTPPSPPTGVVAAAGDTRVTITWNPSAGATSYNIYWGFNPGVTIATGFPITGVTSPHDHTGLTNGTPHYYVVTALNTSGQSAESAEVNATPMAGGGTVATVDIVGVGTIDFSLATHYYNSSWPGPGILLENSNPGGYIIDVFWNDPVTDPGCPYDSCNDTLYVDVTTPTGDFWENMCINDVSLCVTQYATTSGGQTIGTFSGFVEEVSTGNPTLELQNGNFTAVRNY